jgi:chemotaxis signal transduction protein
MRSPQLTHIPGLPGWVLGVTNFHGEIISVVHLAQFLGINRTHTGGEVVVLVAHTADQRIGLVVDDVETIYTTLADQVASPSFRIDPGIVPYLRGAVERNGEFVRLLHGERLLLGQQMQQFS